MAPTGSASADEKRRLLAQKLQARAQRTVFPLSFSQQRLWFLHRMDPDSPAYHIPLALRARGGLDVRVLRRALRDVVRRHEALRTTFTEREGRPVQVVGPGAPDVLARVDLRGLAPADREAELRRLAHDAATRPFDLEHGPLLRAVAVRMDDDEWGLLFTLHHIVADGWSMGVLVRDLSALYAAHARGLDPDLPPVGTQYPEFALWQRGWLKGDVLERETAFWRDGLAGAPRLLQLPTDHPRPAVAGSVGDSRTFALGARTSAALQALARQEGATLFMTLLAAWQLLLGRYAGQDDVLVGTPIAGRTRAELEGVVGFFVNTLVLRARLDAGLSFRRLLRQVRETTLGAYAHQQLPFEKLVEELAVERSLAHTPLFQAMFALQNQERAALALGDARFQALPTGTEAAKFDLNLRAGEGPDGIEGALTFRADLFDAATAERMLAHYTALLRAVAADPDRLLSAHTLLSDSERRQVVVEWNRTDRPVPETCLHHLFQAQADATPGAVAIRHGDRAVTYAQLDAAANRIAHALRRRGVRPEVRVALHLDNGPEQVAGILGVLKAGGAYVPLDTASPADRLAYVIHDSGAALVLADDPAALPDAGVPVLALTADAFADEPDTAPDSTVGPRNLVYVIYTSGSTGRPKGVGVEHRGVCNTVVNYIQAYGMHAGARSLHFAPVHFDASVTDLFTPLCAGATLVTAPRHALIPGPELVEMLRARRVTHAKFTPTALAALPHADLPELEAVMTGGEALPAELVARWAPGRRFINGYGPTETSVRVTAADVTHETRTPPLGRPVANARLYVLDASGQPLPVGVPGELYIGGVGVARGYLGRPTLTAERFVPDALGGVPGARLYRSGDRARWLPDGQLAFAGRVDFQVKVRGIRIEPGEIESALREQPGVADCVVVAREDGGAGARLVAYVVPAAGAALSTAALREGLKGRLPEYLVPAALVLVDALPRGSSGKVDRAALPAPDFGAQAGAYVAPRTPAEELVAGIFADVLKTDPVGARDDFFALGGHSLLATRLISRIRQAFGVELPLRALFECSTVEALAARVEALGAGGDERLAPPVVPVPRDGPLPLSFAQQRLWFLQQMDPASAAYNVPRAVRLSGALDVSALERALTEIVRRHETLRTRFPSIGGEPAQLVDPVAPVAIPVEDLRHLPIGEREAEARRRAADEARAPFDLARGPLLRARLLRLGDDDHALLFTLHHAVSDGWSTGILVREVSALYDAFARGRPSPLAELPVQYADYAAWQRAWLAGEVLESQLAWWRARLADAPPLLELPTDRPRPSVPSDRGANVSFTVPVETAQALRALSRREGATLFMTLLAAWQLLLSRYSGQDDVSVGTPVAGRTRLETEGLIGFFVNTLVLRTDLRGAPTFRALLGRVREATLGAHQHQDVPFEKLVEELAPARSLSHTPLFQAMFVLQNNARETLRLGDLHAVPFAADAESAKFDLTLGVAETDDGLAGSLSYRAALWDAGTMERMAAHWVRALGEIAADADRPPSAVRLLADDERARLVAWSGGPADAPYPCVHDAFARQAARTPDAVALVMDDASLTYAELDARANRLAHHLRARGVGPDAKVALCMERSPEMVVGLMGVLKAGGAYVPLDLAYPAERLAWMARDAGVRVLLTQARLLDALPPHAGTTVCVDRDWPDIERHPAMAPRVDVGPEHLAYVIYTSGSTGTPKGSEVPHRAIPGFFRGADYVRWDAEEVHLQHASPSWDAFTLELWPALLTGARCVLMPARASEPALLGEQVRRHGVTTLWLSAAYFNLVVDTCPEILAGVRQVMTGGEAVSAVHARRLLEIHPHIRLVNGYGPSECTVFASTYVVPPDFDGPVVPIGTPVGDRRVYLVDGAMELAPVGVPSELCVGGPAVARGYLGRPALTADRFVPDPFSAEPGARMYRTGDRVRWMEECVSAEVEECVSAEVEECVSAEVRECGSGSASEHVSRPAQGATHALTHSRTHALLEFVGRVDFQAKVRGFRVEPGEVEAALLDDPRVAEAVVVVREDAPGERRLVAYAVPAEGAAPTATELRDALRSRLPEYMVPGAVVLLDAMPLSAHGKLDRRALPAPEPGGDEAEFVAPRPGAEEVVAGIFAQVLRADRVGATDDFFARGGHSLLATRVASRVRDTFGVELPLRAVFEAPTVQALAARVTELRRAGTGTSAPPLVPVQRTGPLPLSFAQQRLWFIDQLQPGSSAYNMPFALRLRGALDVAALERALTEVVRRHETLRTRFPVHGGEAVQVIDPARPLHLPVTDLADRDADARESALRGMAAREAAGSFDLAAGPLFRASLVRLGDEDHALLLTLHHAVGDAWSRDVLVREVSALYAAHAEGRPAALPELPVQYADYAAWQRAWLTGPVLDAELAWWKARLAGAPPLLQLPTDRPRPPVQTYGGAAVTTRVDGALAERLRALGRRDGATLYMVLLAAFQVLLSRHGAGDDVVVGSPIAGRTRRETEGLIGCFVNTLVMRTDLSGDPEFREVLRRVRDVTLGAYEHQDVPFEKLVEALQPERSLSHAPLFQVLFTMDTTGAGPVERPAGLRMEGMGAEPTAAKFDLSLAVSEGTDGLGALLQYNVDLFERATAERMLARLVHVLEQVAADAHRPLSRLALLSDAERAQVVQEWNATDDPCPPDATLHGLIQAQVARTPDAVALRWGDDALTYAGLNARANQLAHHLVRLGVGPETRVGLCLERGVEMFVALLAVLKAGGAYVPVDPGYPADRIAYLLADSGVPVLLTQERLRAILPPTDAHVVPVDTAWGEIARESTADVRSGATPHTLAYVIYTSGSTGRPKGVQVEHRAAAALLHWMERVVPAEEAACVLASTSLTFDVSVAEIFGTLARGGTLVIVGNALDLAAVPAAAGVRLAYMVPAAAGELLRMGALPSSLRALNLAGEALPAPLARSLRQAGVPRVVNLYGPTEATVYASCAEVEPGAERVTIGRPVPNTRLYVLDAAGQPTPVGVPGELYIGGAQVARGYHGRPALTADRFVPDPFSATPGARLYRTGDRARWSVRADADAPDCSGSAEPRPHSRTPAPTHFLEYLGRWDAQVKIRGVRIEPGEIEAALAAHPGVRECAVLAREDAPGDTRLVAYVVGDAETDALRAHLGRGLPEHMVPGAFVRLDALPLTPNGKLDRRALPAPAYGAPAEAFVAPRTPTEAALAAMWREVLRVERVGIHDNFFALGGHSLLAVRVMGRIRDTFGVQLPLRALFEVRTVAALAREVAGAAPAAAAPAITAEARVESMLAGVDDMSEEELDRLLGDLSLEEEREW